MSLALKMAMKAVSPFLNKIPAWLDSMAKDFGAEECYLMVRKKITVNEDGKQVETPTMLVMGKKDGKLLVMKDQNGKDVEYGIESLFMIGSNSSDDED